MSRPRKTTRSAEVSRKTGETDVRVRLHLDGKGAHEIETGVGFFDHMLTLLSRHALIDLHVSASGDLDVDAHHTVEDVGIVIGEALAEALGDKKGIARYGSAIVPMDESLAQVAIDLSGRPFLAFDATFNGATIGDFPCELVEEFCRALSTAAKMNLHVRLLAGSNNHHIAEAIFKAIARALRDAAAIDPRVSGVPSTKGSL